MTSKKDYINNFGLWLKDCVIFIPKFNINVYNPYIEKNKNKSKEIILTFDKPFINNDIIDTHNKIIENVSDKIDKSCIDCFIKNRNVMRQTYNNLYKTFTINDLIKSIEDMFNNIDERNQPSFINYNTIRSIYNHFKPYNPNITEKDIIDNLKKGNNDFFRNLKYD